MSYYPNQFIEPASSLFVAFCVNDFIALVKNYVSSREFYMDVF